MTAPTEANLPSTNSGFTVIGIGGYRSITPVPTGVSLVPGLARRDRRRRASPPASTRRPSARQAMGYVANTCTANITGNFKTTYPYIETSLNVGTRSPVVRSSACPTVSATWTVTASSGSVSSYETEFVVTTNVKTIGSSRSTPTRPTSRRS